MSEPLFIAVDLGAGSGRVVLGDMAPHGLVMDEVRRFRYPPVQRLGHLRWDLTSIVDEIRAGLVEAARRARDAGRFVRSVGVDGWGVDYGLVDAEGRLVEDPVCYRDDRTLGVVENVLAVVGRDELFRRTGIQHLVFNTIFQLAAHIRDGIPDRAARLLMIPDLVHFVLTGRAMTEHTNATTTQLVDVRTGGWDEALAEKLGIPTRLLCEIVPAGTDLGALRMTPGVDDGLDGVRVVVPATHDTASAVLGTPLRDGWAYISSGTWSLVGVERAEPIVTSDAARLNFTNEGGAYGTTRFLTNVMGLWIVESCRREWHDSGRVVEYDELAEAASGTDAPLIFPDDPRLLNPTSMLGAIAEQLGERGAAMPEDPVAVMRLVLDSLAQRYASVIASIEALTRERIAGVHVVGGGSLNAYLNQATADASGKPVLAGPVEATSLGNLMAQAIAAGRFGSAAEARRYVSDHVSLSRFEPRVSSGEKTRRRRYAAIERRYVDRDSAHAR